LKAHRSEEQKFYFPHEHIDCLKKLNSDKLPNHQVFFSSFNQTYISVKVYQLVQRTWEEKNCKSLRDLLIYYNNLDVGTFIKTVKNLLAPYLAEGFDIYKQIFSVSRAAKLKMLNSVALGSFFSLLPKQHEDLYHELRSQLTGGISIVFSRLAFSEKKPSAHMNLLNQKSLNQFKVMTAILPIYMQ